MLIALVGGWDLWLLERVCVQVYGGDNGRTYLFLNTQPLEEERDDVEKIIFSWSGMCPLGTK